jgi:hypothetical protein
VPIGYRGALLSSLLQVNVYVTHNLLNVLVQTTNKMRLKKIFCLFFDAAGTFLPNRCVATIGGINIQTQRLFGEIYEVRRLDGLRCHDMHTKLHKN